ncbi:MAG: double-cubane-cluster-containing anaerobic reductase [Oscillospiraceae bacterium]
MELKKELPEIFEEFSEQRRNSFISAMILKEEGKPLVGVFCTYFPEEIVAAMGAVTVGLCSTTDETIPDAEKDLPRNLCPLIKSSYGFAKTDKCPFFYFSDLIVGETTCDGKKKMYEYLANFKPVYTMELPNSQSENGAKLWKDEIIKFKEYLERFFEVTITEEKIKEQIKIKNQLRSALKGFYELMKMNPPPMSGTDMFKVLYGEQFKFDKTKLIEEIKELTSKIKSDYENAEEKPIKARPRILITGCPVGGAALKAVKAVEDNGGNVVVFENCGGAKSVDMLVDEQNPDIYDALAKRYLSIGCSVMTPNPNRLVLLDRLIDEYKIDAVIEITLQACHTYNIETLGIKHFVTKEKGIPYMAVETDYSTSDIGQLNTRMAAFVEML